MATLDTLYLDDALELAELLRPEWATIDARLRASGVPLCEGEEGAGDAAGEGAGGGAGDEGAGEGAGEGGEGAAGTEDWKSHARKHEREAKKERKAREEAERLLKERDDADKTEQQKAIDKAREEGKAEALTAAQQERRADRLEVAVTRLSARTFADTEDALTNIERAIAKGDIDAEDIFDSEGKVQTDALQKALEDLLERKPHLAAGAGGGRNGSSDAGKGSGGTSIDDMTTEEHLKRIQNKS